VNSEAVAFTALRGRPVEDSGGRALGRLGDLAVEVGVAGHTTHALIRRGRRAGWQPAAGATLRGPGLRLALPAVAEDSANTAPAPPAGTLSVARDVLDAQVVDVRGRRVARVGEVILTVDPDGLRLSAVEVGPAPVLRRLGLRRLARRAAERPVDWRHVHLTSARGHALQLDAPGSRVRELAPAELAALVEGLPPGRAAPVLDAVGGRRAAHALGHLAGRRRLVAAELMRPASPGTRPEGGVAPDAGRAELLAVFEATDALVVPVVEDGRVVGELHADDVLHALARRRHAARRRPHVRRGGPRAGA
jgi:sporulation protein YlmC with PRC-barrel domain